MAGLYRYASMHTIGLVGRELRVSPPHKKLGGSAWAFFNGICTNKPGQFILLGKKGTNPKPRTPKISMERYYTKAPQCAHILKIATYIVEN